MFKNKIDKHIRKASCTEMNNGFLVHLPPGPFALAAIILSLANICRMARYWIKFLAGRKYCG